MKLSLITSFALYGSFLAAPLTLEKRGVTNTVATVVDTLRSSVDSSLGNINGLVAGVKDNVQASISIVAQVGANWDAIKAAFETAGHSLLSTTTHAVGGVSGAATSLVQEDVDQVTTALNEISTLLKNIRATATLTTTNLTPAARLLVISQINAAKTAVAPFIGPLTIFANEVRSAQTKGSVTVTGLAEATTGALKIFTDLIGKLLG